MIEFLHAHRDINRDFLIGIAHSMALINCRGDVDVPNRATVHEDVTFEVLRRENYGNRA